MKPNVICQDDLRRRQARERKLNGLDFVEVSAAGKLRVYLLLKYPRRPHPAHATEQEWDSTKPRPALPLSPANFRIRGGRRVPEVDVQAVELPHGTVDDRDDVIVLTVEPPNDPSTYTLELVRDPRVAPEDDVLRFFDPRSTTIEFSFSGDCPSELDCAVPTVCPPKVYPEPDIDYLARDYQALRRLILERLTLIAPDWPLRAIPDIGMAIVEILAYTGDRLSYFQDAAATEAYLGTARQRISLRRHARLVDYIVHEGCNARAFVCVGTERDLGPFKPEESLFATALFQDDQTAGAVLPEAAVAPGAPARTTFAPLCAKTGWRLGPEDVFDWAALVWKLVGFGDELRKLREQHSTKELAQIQLADGLRVWIRFPAALRQQLRAAEDERRGSAARGEPGAPITGELQTALLDGLNRILADRGFFRPDDPDSQQVEPDAVVLHDNRRTLEALFGKELAIAGRLQFFAANRVLLFHTWGDRSCCLPVGATSATLCDEILPPPGTPPAARAVAAYGHHDPPPPPPPASRRLRLRVGDVLILQEEIGPKTGVVADADRGHRHAVRLTRVTPGYDDVLRVAVLDIEWAAEDALPFPLCLSTRGPADWVAPDPRDPAGKVTPCPMLENISVAYGNVVLVHHSRRIADEPLGEVGRLELVEDCRCTGSVADPVTVPERPRWRLKKTGLSFREPLESGLPAAKLLRQDPRRAMPGIWLESVPGAPRGDRQCFRWHDLETPEKLAEWLVTELRSPSTAATGAPCANAAARQVYGRLPQPVREWIRTVAAAAPAPFPPIPDPILLELREAIETMLQRWEARPDLLESGADERHFVVEMDDERAGRIRFGLDGHGRTPEAGASFRATYYVGNGEAGNVGGETIKRLIVLGTALHAPALTVRNPLPASGGLEPESAEEVRRNAPFAFRRQLARAITAEDYATIVLREFPAEVQRAAAELRWTGSRYVARVSVDPLGREVAPPRLLQKIKERLARFRRIGHDLEVVSAVLVPLRLALRVCVMPHYQPGHVIGALLQVFSSGRRPNGELGYFHPDRLSFGEAVRLSQVLAAAQAVPGVRSVRATAFHRYFEGPNHEIENGLLPLGPLEIARLENDPAFPENGILTIDMEHSS